MRESARDLVVRQIPTMPCFNSSLESLNQWIKSGDCAQTGQGSETRPDVGKLTGELVLLEVEHLHIKRPSRYNYSTSKPGNWGHRENVS